MPPPTVPTSMEGMEQVINRSSPSLILENGSQKVRLEKQKTRYENSTHASINVMQFELSTFCAGS